MAYDIGAAEQYIRQSAAKRGINPDVAVRVARSEGLARNTYQSNVMKNGVREPSYGPFQLLVGGGNTGFPAGMGNDFIRKTGLDPRDPSTVNSQIDFALDNASRSGWGAWYGAKNAGIPNFMGIRDGGEKSVMAQEGIKAPGGGVFRPTIENAEAGIQPFMGAQGDMADRRGIAPADGQPMPMFNNAQHAPQQPPVDPNRGAGLLAMLADDAPLSMAKAQTFLGGAGPGGSSPMAGAAAGLQMMAQGLDSPRRGPEIVTPPPEANVPQASFMQMLMPRSKRMMV